MGYEGNSRYDIAGTNSAGKTVIGIAPDYIVDELDRNALLGLKKEDEMDRGVYEP